jgi:hypothetical protein
MKDLISYSVFGCFGAALILYCYTFSHFFTKTKTAMNYFPLINFIFALLIPIINVITN